MSKLKELEKRLRDEPGNLGLRVMLAGALHEAGRRDDAIELYRSVAIAYREQGRTQQALMVCRRILELAPDDAPCRALFAALLASQPAAPDATAAAPRKISRSDLPPSLREELERYPDIAGIANAARQISDALIASNRQDDTDAGGADGLDTQRIPRHGAAELDERSGRSPAVPIDRILRELDDDDDEDPTLPPVRGNRRARLGDDDPTLPPASRRSPVRAAADRPTLPLAGEVRRVRAGDDDDDPTLLLDDASARARSGDDDRTLPPAGGAPRVRLVEDARTTPRGLPAVVRPPLAAAPTVPPTVSIEPLASEFFAPVPPHNRPAVLQRFQRQTVATGTTLIRRGELGHGLVIVLHGRLELQVDRADGARVSLGMIAPGGYVGEVSLLARAPGVVHVVAAVDSEVMVLAASDFYEVTGAIPALRAELKAVAALRTREHAQRLRSSGPEGS